LGPSQLFSYRRPSASITTSDGTLAATLGHDQEAIDAYRKAIRWDSWHAHNIDLYATIGELQKRAGISQTSAERHINRAVELRSENEFEAALFEFSRAIEGGGALAETAQREIALTRVSLGLALYRAGGVGSAVMNWEVALTEDPSLIYVLPYLARGYYDLSRYQAGIDAAERLAKLIKGHNFALANAYSAAGDCYAKLGKDAEARRYYSLSLAADPILNYWALTGLVGEYMEDRSAQEKYLPLRALRWSWALVVVCGLLLGYYLLQTYGLPRHRQYQLDFGKAEWIEPAESPAPIAYFRKEIYVNSSPAQAWIEIAASDNFGLIVNGHTIGNLGSVKSFETGIYDIKRALKLGTNVIAVSISRTSYPGPAQLRIRGEIVAPSGTTTQILSDETWRVTNRTGIVEGTEEWNGKRVPDQTWPTARRSPLNDQHVPVRWVDTNPLLLQMPRIGYWIMAENAPSEAVFSTTINADRSKQETWIQIASSGDLDLAINGHIITLASSAAKGAKKLPHLPTIEATPAEGDKLGRAAEVGVAPAKEGSSPFEMVDLSAYDVSY
jgi:tetratricopeptide (TPR) repeat protein